MNSFVRFGALTVVCAAGCAVAHDDLQVAQANSGRVRHVGHIYFNLATGERISTLIEGAERMGLDAAGVVSEEIWVMGGLESCGDDPEVDYYFLVDTFSTSPCSGTSCSQSRLILFDWGDIPANTVVDCVQVHWLSNHVDTDLDQDGVGDGVDGFGALWTFWDGMNGRSPQFESIAQPIVSFEFYNLPGEVSDPNDSMIAYYTMDVDLAADFASSLTFEIGDTDSDPQGAAIHNTRMDLRDNEYIDSMTIGDGIPDLDPDEDGLADWGWSVDFIQPGTRDFDNADGDSDPHTGVDGDPDAVGEAGVNCGHPLPSKAVFDEMLDRWVWVPTGPTAGVTEDVFNTGHLDHNTGAIVLDGPWWFGGFSCDSDMGPGIVPNPFAGFQITLYQKFPDEACRSDLNVDGYLDFLDFQIFISEQPDLTGDGAFDFLDFQVFSRAFFEGCLGYE